MNLVNLQYILKLARKNNNKLTNSSNSIISGNSVYIFTAKKFLNRLNFLKKIIKMQSISFRNHFQVINYKITLLSRYPNVGYNKKI